ncbi:glutaredoxin domain-containing protein [Cryptosporangium sp. NPDC051539]|uniref:glutaredoxin domain-containing protein n=1 Tax=Cryptosporangium sp. NPDC051539 TaxID=3363962 RepID=UPI0037A53622
MRNWKLALMVAGGGVVGAAVLFAAGSGLAGVLFLVWFLGCAAVSSPLLVRSVSDAEARGDGRPIVYWRPGCPFCLRMRVRLGLTGRRANWVNIWSDPAGAAAVRAVAGGNETVPTVVTAAGAHVNPPVAEVRDWLRAA